MVQISTSALAVEDPRRSSVPAECAWCQPHRRQRQDVSYGICDAHLERELASARVLLFPVTTPFFPPRRPVDVWLLDGLS
jgi:hypothetical protein